MARFPTLIEFEIIMLITEAELPCMKTFSLQNVLSIQDMPAGGKGVSSKKLGKNKCSRALFTQFYRYLFGILQKYA